MHATPTAKGPGLAMLGGLLATILLWSIALAITF